LQPSWRGTRAGSRGWSFRRRIWCRARDRLPGFAATVWPRRRGGACARETGSVADPARSACPGAGGRHRIALRRGCARRKRHSSVRRVGGGRGSGW
jgi:hypothetical protein